MRRTERGLTPGPPRGARRRRVPGGPGWRDRGSATVWAAIGALVPVAAAVVGLAVAGAAVARHRAGGAADLAALAAADRIAVGAPVACEAAARVARRHGAVLVTCDVHGQVVDVVTEVRGPPWTASLGPARAAARAGPAAPAPAPAPAPDGVSPRALPGR